MLAAARQLASRTQASREQIRQQLIASPVVHFNQSGLRVGGRLHWLNVVGTENLIHYHVHGKRGHVGMRVGGILPHFAGVALHDYWRSYFKFQDCQHSFCNVHLLRELRLTVEQYEQAWAAQMERLLLDIKAEVASTSQPHTALPPDRLAHYEAQYDGLIAQGFADNPSAAKTKPRPIGRPKQSPSKNLLDRLHKHKAGVLAFRFDFRIPFDNNLVERDVRMIKVQQKSPAASVLLTAHMFSVRYVPISLPHVNLASTPLMPSTTLSFTNPSSLTPLSLCSCVFSAE